MGYLKILNLEINRSKNKITYQSKYNNDSEPYVEDSFGEHIIDFDDKYAKFIFYIIKGAIQCFDLHCLAKLNCTYDLLEGYIKDYGELGPLGIYAKYQEEIACIVGEKLDISTDKIKDQYIGSLDLDMYVLAAVNDEYTALDMLNQIYLNNIILNRFIRDKFTYMKDITDDNKKRYEESKKAFEEEYDIVGEVEEVRDRSNNLTKLLSDYEEHLIKYGNGKLLFDSFPEELSTSENRKDLTYGGIKIPIIFQNGKTTMMDSIFVKDQNRNIILFEEESSIEEIINSTAITNTEEIEFLHSRIKAIEGQYEENKEKEDIEEDECI